MAVSVRHIENHVPGIEHGFKYFSCICFLELCDAVEGNTRDATEKIKGVVDQLSC